MEDNVVLGLKKFEKQYQTILEKATVTQ